MYLAFHEGILKSLSTQVRRLECLSSDSFLREASELQSRISCHLHTFHSFSGIFEEVKMQSFSGSIGTAGVQLEQDCEVFLDRLESTSAFQLDNQGLT